MRAVTTFKPLVAGAALSTLRREAAVYKPFGEQTEVLQPTQVNPEQKGWIGQRYDADAGLQYLNARYYDPEYGFFLQPDWFEVTAAGVGTNRYSYSFNDPVNMRDPGGNDSASCSDDGGSTSCSVRRDDGADTLTYDYKGSITNRQYFNGTFEDAVLSVVFEDVPLSEWAQRIAVHKSEIGSTSGGTLREMWMSEDQANASLTLAHLLLGYAIGGKARSAISNTGKVIPQPSLPPYTGGKTVGVLRTNYGDVSLASGWNGFASVLGKTPGMNLVTKSHVEGHAAAVMRTEGIDSATLFINNDPCGGSRGCSAMLSRMLPEGARLRVVNPFTGYDSTFVGIAD